jgi:hypothetical protein
MKRKCRECGGPVPDDYEEDICDKCYNDLAEQEAEDEEE